MTRPMPFPYKLGTTATRKPLTVGQKAVIVAHIGSGAVEEVHHGDCIGGDAFIHHAALEAGKRIVVHPPVIDALRAFCTGPADQVIVLPPKPYHDRNRDIVDATHKMLAAPKGPEKAGSGTWWTVDYGLSQGRVVVIVNPTGHITVMERIKD